MCHLLCFSLGKRTIIEARISSWPHVWCLFFPLSEEDTPQSHGMVLYDSGDVHRLEHLLRSRRHASVVRFS